MLIAYLALFASTQTPTGSVTYTNAGARLERLLPELSKACHTKLTSNPELRDLVVVLRLRHAPLQKAMDQIAYVVRGRWEAVPGGFNLVFDGAGIAAERARETERFHSEIHRLLAQASKPYDWKQRLNPNLLKTDLDRMRRNAEFVNAWRNLLRAFDESQLWDSVPNHPLVFSTQPKPLQRPMPAALTALIPPLFDAASKADPSPMLRHPKPPGKPTRLTLTFTYENNVQTSLTVVGAISDADGIVIAAPTAFPMGANVGQWDPVLGNEPRSTANLRISPAFKELRRYVTAAGPMTPSVRRFLTTPLDHDPLSWYGEELVDLARLRSRQLAACLTDSMGLRVYGRPTGLEIENVQISLAMFGKRPYPGWIDVRPDFDKADVPGNPAQNADRRMIERFASAAPKLSSGSLTDEVAADRLGFNRILGMPQAAMLGELGGYGEEGFDRDSGLTRLSLLTDGEITALLAGRRLPISETPAPFQANFTRMLTRGYRLFRLPEQSNNTAYGGPMLAVMFGDPTEVADGPVPTGSTVELHRSIGNGFEVQGGGDRLRRVSAYFFAPMPDRYFRVHRFRLGILASYEIRFFIAPGVYLSDGFFACEFSPSARWVRFSELPKAARTEIMGRVAENRMPHPPPH